MVPADIKPDLADASVPVGDLTWVNEIIWGTPVGVTVGRERPSGVTALAEFVALPNAHHAHLLIPIDSPPAAQRALETYVDARRTIRAGAALLAMAVRARIIPPLGGRVYVSAVAGQTGAGNGTPSLTAYLSGVLGCDEVKIAVRMGGRRPNRKPVLQVLTPDGAVLAYVKVGWNDLTRSLVRNEAQVLRTFAESAWQPTSFVWPRLRHSGTCGELEIIVMAPVPPGPWFRRVASHVELATLVREIARMAPETREELGASAYWRQTMCRLALLADSIRPSRLEVLQGLVSRLEDRYGAVELAFGGSHGDLTRWNMARRESKLVIFDWERSGSKAPVGMDAAHFDFDLAVKFHRNSPPYAVRSLLAGDGGVLPHFTSKAVPARLLLALDLLEMVLRYEEARSAGLDVPDTLYFGAFRSAVLSAGVG